MTPTPNGPRATAQGSGPRGAPTPREVTRNRGAGVSRGRPQFRCVVRRAVLQGPANFVRESRPFRVHLQSVEA
jgi:hypothetical protein